MPEWGILGRCVGVNFLKGSHHEHTVASFVEEIQATASIDFGGRFRSAMRRLGRLGELDDMLVHGFWRQSRTFRASVQGREFFESTTVFKSRGQHPILRQSS